MSRSKPDTKLELLEKQRREIEAAIRAAKENATKRKKEEAARRKSLLGGAVMAHFKGNELAKLIRAVIPPHVKAKDDLTLFEEWLEAEAIEADATDPG